MAQRGRGMRLMSSRLRLWPVWGIFFFLWAIPLFAQTQTTTQTVSVVSAADMLANIAQEVPILMQLVTAIAYVMGIYFIFYGILKLKEFGEARTQMSSERHLKGPLVLIVVGALLLYLPTTVQVGLSTFWSNPSPYGYVQQSDQWSDFMKDVYLVIQLFGTIAFIRGLVILSHLSGSHSQQGTFAKGVTHVIGGLFCINIYQFVQVVLITLGIQT